MAGTTEGAIDYLEMKMKRDIETLRAQKNTLNLQEQEVKTKLWWLHFIESLTTNPTKLVVVKSGNVVLFEQNLDDKRIVSDIISILLNTYCEKYNYITIKNPRKIAKKTLYLLKNVLKALEDITDFTIDIPSNDGKSGYIGYYGHSVVFEIKDVFRRHISQ